ncbi:MAG: type IV toxin-antitoxin system AbiEi family antitoxin [Calothrix sp. MO_192.B10]|nr:type IV toxin-antitoxin system AbiEi family antitoxin [Calothrix sp. MO_192.B10]
MGDENKLLQDCLEKLKALPNIQVTPKKIPNTKIDSSADGIITIRSPLKSVDYVYAIQPNVTGTTAELVIAYFKLHQEKLTKKLFLITRYLSEPAIAKLVENNIEFIDTAGNIYLNSPAAYILIRGQHRPKEKYTSPLQITPNNLKVIYILLKLPNILKASLKELADAAGVTSTTANHTLKNLYRLGYLQRQPGGNYRIAHYSKLLERWEIGYIESLRPKLLLGHFTPVVKGKLAEILDNIIQQAKEKNFLIGGELGAALTSSYLVPTGATLHVKDNYRLIAAKLKLKPSPEGKIIFLQQFGLDNAGDYNQAEPIADPLLIHAELMMENNERLEETAKRIFIKYIEPRQQNA